VLDKFRLNTARNGETFGSCYIRDDFGSKVHVDYKVGKISTDCRETVPHYVSS
jgi:hypothetical protein